MKLTKGYHRYRSLISTSVSWRSTIWPFYSKLRTIPRELLSKKERSRPYIVLKYYFSSLEDSNLNEDDLKMVWFCDDCGSSFFFSSDALDHRKVSMHFSISKFDLRSGGFISEASKKSTPTPVLSTCPCTCFRHCCKKF